MFLLGVFCTLLVTVSADLCFHDVEAACYKFDDPELQNCNSKYGGFTYLESDLQAYVNGQIETSFELLFMPGLKGLYRKLSDSTWKKSIDMINYITKRGGKMNFNQLSHFKNNSKSKRFYDLSQIESLAKVLDTMKQLTEEALRLQFNADERRKDHDVAHYMAKEFVVPQTKIVRTLAGHVSDLKSLAESGQDAALAAFLFDEHVKSTLWNTRAAYPEQ